MSANWVSDIRKVLLGLAVQALQCRKAKTCHYNKPGIAVLCVLFVCQCIPVGCALGALCPNRLASSKACT